MVRKKAKKYSTKKYKKNVNNRNGDIACRNKLENVQSKENINESNIEGDTGSIVKDCCYLNGDGSICLEQLDVFLEGYFKEQVAEVKCCLENGSGHMLVSYVDDYIEIFMTKIIERESEALGRRVVCKYVGNLPEGGVIILNTKSYKGTKLQMILYRLFQGHKNTTFFLFSSSCSVIDDMEKRVRSRFNGKYVFFPFLPYEVFQNINVPLEEYETDPTLSFHLKNYTMKKHAIQKFTLSTQLQMLKPVHHVLLLMSIKSETNTKNAHNKFKKITINCPELRNTTEREILNTLYDLEELELITYKGTTNIEEKIYLDYIKNNTYQYIRNIIKEL